MELPSGTVTFLFTDIEGSTRLLTRLRERYADVLADQQRLLRAAFEDSGGREIDTQGDSFFVAFRTAKDAVAAAVAAQRALDAHEWPDGVELRVRMGLHTGEPAVGTDRYVGLGVVRAARLMAAGHGGQILLSAATRELIEDDLPPGVTVRDLGEQRLKDLERPERVSQLVVEGLPADFPPLRTVEAATPYTGREGELARAAQAAMNPRSFLRRRLVGTVAAGLVASAVAVTVFVIGRGDSVSDDLSGSGENSIVVIDPETEKTIRRIPLGTTPARIAVGGGAVWVVSADDQTVLRVDPKTSSVMKTIGLGFSPVDIAVATDGVWVAGGVENAAVRIDPRHNRVAQTIEFLERGILPGNAAAVAAGAGAVWVLNENRVSRIDEPAGDLDRSVRNVFGDAIAEGEGAVWVTARGSPSSGIAGSLSRVDPGTRSVGPAIPLTGGPSGVAAGAGAIWVAASTSDSVWRVDPVTSRAERTIPVGDDPTAVAVGSGSVWVANSRDGTVSRINPATNGVETIAVGGSPQSVAVGANAVWVAVARRGPVDAGASASGVKAIRVNAGDGLDFVDPALAYSNISWQLLYATCAKLMNFPDRAAPEGSRIQPEVAAAPPAVSEDGRTFTFTIRDGFRFSSPSAERVTARTFKYAIERALSPRIRPLGFFFASDIVGATAYHEGKARLRRGRSWPEAHDHAHPSGGRSSSAPDDAVLLRSPDESAHQPEW